MFLLVSDILPQVQSPETEAQQHKAYCRLTQHLALAAEQVAVFIWFLLVFLFFFCFLFFPADPSFVFLFLCFFGKCLS